MDFTRIVRATPGFILAATFIMGMLALAPLGEAAQEQPTVEEIVVTGTKIRPYHGGLKDGASALYGSDAVAGVVNVITRDGFEGLEVQVDFRADQASSAISPSVESGESRTSAAIW